MLGAIAGDVIGSIYEADPIKSTDFPLFDPACSFTDDTVLTVAIASALLEGAGDYANQLRKYYSLYPYAGYGGFFHKWARSPEPAPYNSFGNGSAMRVSPVAWAFDDLAQVRREAQRTAEVTHNHPAGVRGAEATAAAVFLARQRESKQTIHGYVEEQFGYDLARTPDKIRPTYAFDVTCQGTVPEALCCFLHSDGYEETIRNAISLGGDSDTLACIAGAVAGAFWGVPQTIAAEVLRRLDGHLRSVVTRFIERFGA